MRTAAFDVPAEGMSAFAQEMDDLQARCRGGVGEIYGRYTGDLREIYARSTGDLGEI